MEETLTQLDSTRQEMKVLSNIYNALATFRDREDVYGLAEAVQGLFTTRQAEQQDLVNHLVQLAANANDQLTDPRDQE